MKTVKSIRSYLLSSNIYVDNNYFNLYVKLLEDNLNTLPKKGLTQKHHILPRHYFKHKNIKIDNSRDNLVNLSISDHIRAHYYLYNCSINNDDKLSNLYCLRRMLDGRYANLKNISDINDDECEKLYKELCEYNSKMHKNKTHSTTESTRLKISKSNKGKYSNYKSIHLGDLEKRVPIDDLPVYLSKGYILGRSDKTKNNLSKGYNYASKGMLGKNQSHYQKERVSQLLRGRQKSEKAKTAMSLTKQGTKKYINPETGKVKYIKPDEVNYYESLGFYKYKKNR